MRCDFLHGWAARFQVRCWHFQMQPKPKKSNIFTPSIVVKHPPAGKVLLDTISRLNSIYNCIRFMQSRNEVMEPTLRAKGR